MPLIAETGGINAMIVDATALPEQVCRRRGALRLPLGRTALLGAAACSACRKMSPIACSRWSTGAAKELRLGDPRDPSVQIGPVIDAEAKQKLDAYAARMRTEGRTLYRRDGAFDRDLRGARDHPSSSAPRDLKQEVFGPILHVVR